MLNYHQTIFSADKRTGAFYFQMKNSEYGALAARNAIHTYIYWVSQKKNVRLTDCGIALSHLIIVN